MPALLAAPWRSSSASSSLRTCAELSGARGARPSRAAHRDPREKHSHIKRSSFASEWRGNVQSNGDTKRPRMRGEFSVQLMKLPYI